MLDHSCPHLETKAGILYDVFDCGWKIDFQVCHVCICHRLTLAATSPCSPCISIRPPSLGSSCSYRSDGFFALRMSTSQIPPGKTWFDTHKVHFSDVPIASPDQGILTVAFLDAAEATTTLFDLLGSVAFTPVKNDMIGNINKVRERHQASPHTSTTLQSLVKSELASKSHRATEGLLWLTRGLDFTSQALRADLTSNAAISAAHHKPNKELADGFRTSYKNTLAPHHSFLVKPVFSAAMSATPYRRDFYVRLCGEGTDPEVSKEALELWVAALEERVAILNEFLASTEAKW